MEKQLLEKIVIILQNLYLNNEIKMKYLKLLLLSILQYAFIYILLYIYNELNEIKGVKLAINISFYYYLIAVLPIAIIIWNITFIKVKSMMNKYLSLCLPVFIIVSYWIEPIKTNPYRVSFTILISIVTLIIGSIIIKRCILKNVIL